MWLLCGSGRSELFWVSAGSNNKSSFVCSPSSICMSGWPAQEGGCSAIGSAVIVSGTCGCPALVSSLEIAVANNVSGGRGGGRSSCFICVL